MKLDRKVSNTCPKILFLFECIQYKQYGSSGEKNKTAHPTRDIELELTNSPDTDLHAAGVSFRFYTMVNSACCHAN